MAALASAVVLVIALVVLRLERGIRVRRLAAHIARWRMALHVAMESPGEATLPDIAPVDLPVFLQLWNHLQESLRGEASDNLARVVREKGLVPAIRELAIRRALRHRLVAITALGHLREAAAWELLASLARDPDPVLSFAAVRALLRIDARRALEDHLADAVHRADWSLARLGTALQEAGPDEVTPPMERVLADPPADGLERLLKLAKFAHRERVSAMIHGWLGASAKAHVIAAALDFVEDAADLPRVRGATRHGAWHVRMSAARALGRIGGERELALLLAMLDDPSWWVRYHAAQAIVALPGLAQRDLEQFRARAPSGVAAAMLAQVLAERSRA
ncbi:MAG TPA: HEAT repeat domain-containing protein [Usitatibacteraceae bacterium]|nr:HEAT repeat domain-containing protein [Usitatibacteraceae bacterium]